jgi:hypothetical protein
MGMTRVFTMRNSDTFKTVFFKKQVRIELGDLGRDIIHTREDS